jgi:hypothetical protein
VDGVYLHLAHQSVEVGDFALLEEVLELVEDAEGVCYDFLYLIGSELAAQDLYVLRDIVDFDFEDVEEFLVVGSQFGLLLAHLSIFYNYSISTKPSITP